MQRYFLSYDPSDQVIIIEGDDAHHIRNVMRMKVGSTIYVSNNEVVHYAVIKGFTDQGVKCELQYEVKENRELPVNVTIAQGMPKGNKFELIIQKTTELGVSEIIPVLSERSIVKIDPKKEKRKIERYQKIAKEASEQSHRVKIPTITSFMSLEDFILYAESFDYKVVAYEATTEAERHNLYHVIKTLKPNDSLLVFIGPEGGISENELTVLKEHDFQIVSLGQRILRTETAPIFVMSSVVYELEVKG